MKKIIPFLFCFSLCSIFGTAQKISKRIDAFMDSIAAAGQFNGSILVSKKGKTVYEKAFGDRDAAQHLPNTSNTIYQTGALTMEFTAAVILKFAEQNKLSLDDKLSKYIPSYVRGDEITIRSLLTHSSGIYDISADPKAVAAYTQPMSRAELLSFFINRPLDFTPGTKFSFSSPGYILLGLIIENITGKPYYQVVHELILKPLKMKHTGFDFAGLSNEDKATGYTKYTNEAHERSVGWDSTATFSAGSLYSTAEDLYRWYKALSRYKFYSRETMEQACTPYPGGYCFGGKVDSLYENKIVSQTGNVPGFSSYFGRVQEDHVCVTLLNNINNAKLEMIGQGVFGILYRKP